MKRSDLIRELIKRGARLDRRGHHEIYKKGETIIPVPYHREINKFLAKKILNQVDQAA